MRKTIVFTNKPFPLPSGKQICTNKTNTIIHNADAGLHNKPLSFSGNRSGLGTHLFQKSLLRERERGKTNAQQRDAKNTKNAILVALSTGTLIREMHPPLQSEEGTSVVQAEKVDDWDPWHGEHVPGECKKGTVTDPRDQKDHKHKLPNKIKNMQSWPFTHKVQRPMYVRFVVLFQLSIKKEVICSV